MQTWSTHYGHQLPATLLSCGSILNKTGADLKPQLNDYETHLK